MDIIKKKKYNILSIILKYSFVFIIALALVLPVLAADPVPCTGPNIPKGCVDSKDTNNPDSKDSNGVKIDTGIHNPISGIEDIPSFIQAILNFVLIVAIPIIVLAIIYSGFLFVTAGGNSEKLGKAKKTLLYTIIGAALLLGSFVIAQAIKGTVDEIRKTS